METDITPSSGKDCGKIRRRLCRIHPVAIKVRGAVTQQESLNRQTLPVPVVIPRK